METIVASVISSCLLLAGTVYTVRKNRHVTTKQHVEQTEQLVSIQQNQRVMLDTIQMHREHTEAKLDRLQDHVAALNNTTDVLFNMVVEVDSKVTKPAYNRKKVQVSDV
jgi:outer membrane murein-binding lipoprotein Lpp